MIDKKDNDASEASKDRDKMPDELRDEVAAATEELKAAQAKLDAAKAKLQATATPPTQGAPSNQGVTSGASTPPPNPYVQQPYYTSYDPVNTVPPQTPQPQQQYYYQQQQAQPMVATKDHVAAGLLGIFLGSLGIHKFYLGYNTAGFIMLAVTILGSIITLGLAGAVIGLIGLIEGILYLTKQQSEFEQLYVFNKREWF